MAAPKMTRHDMKQDDLVTALERTKSYVDRNPMMVRNIGIAVAAVIILGGGFYWWRSSSAEAAADLMREAQARLNGQVVPSGADPLSPLSPSYATEAERDKAALESFTKLATGYGGSAEGRVAQYYQGMLLARAGKAQEAEAALTSFIGHGSSGLMTNFAKVQLAQLHEQRGDLDGAAKMYSEIADSKASTERGWVARLLEGIGLSKPPIEPIGAYPRDMVLFYLAGVQEKQGKAAEAAKTYGMLAKEFPTSAHAAEATRKSKGA